ncbi:hypothetical protein PWT90_07873 [Aphanocladium album]|nr:hypothetical protein PWT90_07873 [Aphanocladium album]
MSGKQFNRKHSTSSDGSNSVSSQHFETGDGNDSGKVGDNDAKRRMQNRLAQRRYREKQKLQRQLINEEDLDDSDDLQPQVASSSWGDGDFLSMGLESGSLDLSNAAPAGTHDSFLHGSSMWDLAGPPSQLLNMAMNEDLSGCLSQLEFDSIFPPVDIAAEPSLCIDAAATGTATPLLNVPRGGRPQAPVATRSGRDSGYISKLEERAGNIVMELQNLYRIGVDLDMLQYDPQLVQDLGILPDRFSALIALQQVQSPGRSLSPSHSSGGCSSSGDSPSGSGQDSIQGGKHKARSKAHR